MPVLLDLVNEIALPLTSFSRPVLAGEGGAEPSSGIRRGNPTAARRQTRSGIRRAPVLQLGDPF